MKSLSCQVVPGLLVLFALLMPVQAVRVQSLTFTIENAQISTIGGTAYFEFDVFVVAGAATNLGATLVLINYDPLGFGTNVKAGGTVTVTQGSLIDANPDYSLTINDNAPARLAIVGFFNFLNPAAIASGPTVSTATVSSVSTSSAAVRTPRT